MNTWFDELKTCIDTFTGDIKQAKEIIFGAERVWIVGNGGSAAIASHIATDFTKNASLMAMAFNDPSLLTCYANDFGYEEVFAKALQYFAIPDDCLIVISSSGKSKNMIAAAEQADAMGMQVITLTGFDPENPLRRMGDINFYVPSNSYGHVEVTHLSILHSMVPWDEGS